MHYAILLPAIFIVGRGHSAGDPLGPLDRGTKCIGRVLSRYSIEVERA